MINKNDIEKLNPFSKKIEIASGHMMAIDDINSIQNYVDERDEKGVGIDFKKFMNKVYSQRLSNQEKSGIHFDPIDDAPWMAQPEDLVGFMRPDQIILHFDGLLDTESSRVADRIVAKMAPSAINSNVHEDDRDLEMAETAQTFLNDHLVELLTAGANPDKLSKNLTTDQTRANKKLLIEHGASRLKISANLAFAALLQK